jgi:hypothetical protein
MPPAFKNMDELKAYLDQLERRVDAIDQKQAPQTNLISRNFLKRAFAVWGHFFVANLIISTVIGTIYLCLAATMFGAILNSIKLPPLRPTDIPRPIIRETAQPENQTINPEPTEASKTTRPQPTQTFTPFNPGGM